MRGFYLFGAIGEFMSLKFLLVFLGGGAGVAVLSWILGGFSAYMKKRIEEQRVASAVLFNLLEIRRQLVLHAQDSEELSENYRKLLEKKIEQHFPSETFSENDINILVSSYLLGVERVRNTLFKSSEDLRKDYKQCVKDMASISPLLAYRLNGREQIQNLLLDADAMSDEIASHMPPNASASDIALNKLTRKETRTKLLRVIFKSLDEDILAIAWVAGQYAKTRWAYSQFGIFGARKAKQIDREGEKMGDELLTAFKREREKLSGKQ